jgi:trigger factor
MLDFSGAVGGTVFDGRTGVWLEVAPQTYIPGFCGAIAGMNREETRSFTLTLPDDVKPEDLRGKEASFNVTLHEIKQKKVPELNDEFCKELGNYAGVKELRDAVRNDLLAYAEAEESRNVLEQINTYLLEHLTVPLPQRRLNAETASLAEKTAARLLSQGVKKEEIVEKKEELLAAARKQAERNLRLACIYEEVAKRERITVSPEEVEERLKRIAAGLKRDLEQVRAAMEREGGISALRKEIESDRVAEFLMKNARIKEAKNP